MKNKKQKIIELYEKVQKVPYYCLKERNPDKLFELNKGSCFEKNSYLGKQYEKLGIPVKYQLIVFDWRELPVPKDIMDKRENKLGEHLALKIMVDNKWVFVDPTWDPALEKAGFPLTKNWDGESDTKLAVKPKKIRELKQSPEKAVVTANTGFHDLFNKYLEKIRKKNH